MTTGIVSAAMTTAKVSAPTMTTGVVSAAMTTAEVSAPTMTTSAMTPSAMTTSAVTPTAAFRPWTFGRQRKCPKRSRNCQNESQIGLHGLLPLGWSNALVFPETLNQSHRCMLWLLVSIPLGTHEDDPQTSFFAVKSREQKNYLFHSRPYAWRRRLGCLLKVVSQL
jgi:hypothetical protein